MTTTSVGSSPSSELGCNGGTDYAERPVGNSPEMMPFDASLNRDVDVCVDAHVAITRDLADDDPRKFSKKGEGKTPTVRGKHRLSCGCMQMQRRQAR